MSSTAEAGSIHAEALFSLTTSVIGSWVSSPHVEALADDVAVVIKVVVVGFVKTDDVLVLKSTDVE